jgi:hypothetical protein
MTVKSLTVSASRAILYFWRDDALEPLEPRRSRWRNFVCGGLTGVAAAPRCNGGQALSTQALRWRCYSTCRLLGGGGTVAAVVTWQTTGDGAESVTYGDAWQHAQPRAWRSVFCAIWHKHSTQAGTIQDNCSKAVVQLASGTVATGSGEETTVAGQRQHPLIGWGRTYCAALG